MKHVEPPRSHAPLCVFVVMLLLSCRAAMAQSAAQVSALPRQELAASKIAAAPADTPSVERAALTDFDSNDGGSAEGYSIAQTSSTPDNQKTKYKPVRCDIDSLGRCLKDLLGDEAGIWTSPLRIRPRDAFWLVPLGLATGAALATDSKASAAVGFNPSRVRFSKDYSDGMEYGAIGAAGGLYLLGKFTHNEHARETGVLSVEAIIDSAIVVEVLKLATNRQRPNALTGAGKFWPDDSEIFITSGSFPSGHSAAVWAVAHVIADETPGNIWLHIGVYLLATSTAITRVTAQEHFPSDALVGSAIGYLVGGYVYRHHSEAGGREGTPVMILPFSDASTRSTGVLVSLDPTTMHWRSAQELWSKSIGALWSFHSAGN